MNAHTGRRSSHRWIAAAAAVLLLALSFGTSGPREAGAATPPPYMKAQLTSPAVYGFETSIFVTVYSGYGVPIGAGEVQLIFNGQVYDDQPLGETGTVGQAILTFTPWAPGDFVFTLEYEDTSFDHAFDSFSQAFKVTVNPANTSTTLTVSPNPVAFGQAITMSASVGSPIGPPPGQVEFLIDGTGVTATLDASGTATATVSAADLPPGTLGAGAHTVTAVYSPPSGNYLASSTSLTLQVDQASVASGPGDVPSPPAAGSGMLAQPGGYGSSVPVVRALLVTGVLLLVAWRRSCREGSN